MSFLSKLFGGGGAAKEVNRQLPSTMVAKEFGEVNIKRVGNDNEQSDDRSPSTGLGPEWDGS